MKAPARFIVLLAVGGALTLSGCGKSDQDHDHAKESPGEHAHDHAEKPPGADEHDHDHDHDHGEEEGAAAWFEAGRGLELAAETTRAIGLTIATVETRPLAARTEITATVFDAGPPARATALAPIADADTFAADPRVLAVHRETLSALGQIELIVAAPGTPAIGATLVLELHAPTRATRCVPGSAVLRTATGNFVYVQRGEHWARTAVTTGATDGGFTAITDGLAVGDTVAATAVEHLWLTELRLTKGGGHSH